jgi:hypothetical protein
MIQEQIGNDRIGDDWIRRLEVGSLTSSGSDVIAMGWLAGKSGSPARASDGSMPRNPRL